MHTVELLEQALRTAQHLGYQVRQEWLGGSGGGGCQIAGKDCIFVDLALPAIEQLDQVLETLREDPGVYTLRLAPELGAELGIRRAA
jgi:hypothetical protein